MPFTLAHPAAVLPLRRLCPRWLCFPALVAGSISPDLWYVGQHWGVDLSAHRFWGTLLLDLPTGVVLAALFYSLRLPVLRRSPPLCRPLLQPFCRVPLCSPLSAILSVLIGTWTHLLLDNLTHKNGWLVQALPLFQIPLWSVGYRAFRCYHFLWYALSFLGVMWLYLAFENWKQAQTPSPPPLNRRLKWGQAVSLAALLVPFELIHHLLPVPWLNLLAAFITAAAMALLLWRDWFLHDLHSLKP